MKIGYIISLIAYGTGVSVYTYNLIKAMAKISDHEFVLLKDKHYTSDLTRNFRCINLPNSRKLWRKVAFGSSFLKKIQRKEKFDIIHDPSQIGPFLFNLGSKNLLTIFDVTPLKFKEYHATQSYLLHKYFLPITLRNIDKIITISLSSKNDILHFYKVPDSKVEIIYLAAEDIYKKIENEGELVQIRQKYGFPPKFILYVGTLEPRKGIDALLKSFAQIKHKLPDYKLVIVGRKGWQYAHIFKLVSKLQISERVIFTGYVPKEDLPYLYNLAELFVYPSRYEGFGLPVLEAMACGCPVVTCETSSITEIADSKSVVLVRPNDPIMLAKSILNIIQHTELRENLVIEGFQRAKDFSWEKTARKTINVYEQLAQ